MDGTPTVSSTISVAEAADLLGISRTLAYQLAGAGELAGVPVIKLGQRRMVIPRAPFLKALGIEDSRQRISAEAGG